MYSWSTLLNEFQAAAACANNPEAGFKYLIDKKSEFLRDLSALTSRNTIVYFSSWLHKKHENANINDNDMNAFMECVHKLDQSKGLDLILHTPGGDLAATEQLINYLKSVFNGDVRAIIPQMAMSAGSMIAVSCKSIVMGKQSCLGPFDPQLNGVPCQSVIREFQRAVEDIEKSPSSLGLWQTIISKLNPTFLELCLQANQLSNELTDLILADKGLDENAKAKIKQVFVNNSESKTHSRHISRDKCKEAGLNIENLEDSQQIQDLVLGIHHCCMILGENTNIIKSVENNIGGGFVCQATPTQINLQPHPHP